MTYTVIVCKNGVERVFEGIDNFVAMPGSIWLNFGGQWVSLKDVDGLIIHEEQSSVYTAYDTLDWTFT